MKADEKKEQREKKLACEKVKSSNFKHGLEKLLRLKLILFHHFSAEGPEADEAVG